MPSHRCYLVIYEFVLTPPPAIVKVPALTGIATSVFINPVTSVVTHADINVVTKVASVRCYKYCC